MTPSLSEQIIRRERAYSPGIENFERLVADGQHGAMVEARWPTRQQHDATWTCCAGRSQWRLIALSAPDQAPSRGRQSGLSGHAAYPRPQTRRCDTLGQMLRRDGLEYRRGL